MKNDLKFEFNSIKELKDFYSLVLLLQKEFNYEVQKSSDVLAKNLYDRYLKKYKNPKQKLEFWWYLADNQFKVWEIL